MELVDIKSLTIAPNRQRKYIDKTKIAELAESIKTRGLLHAIVLRKTEQGFELVAGERRTRAMIVLHTEGKPFHHNGQIVPKGTFPYTLLSDADALNAREAELEENIIRVDLSWQERVAAIDELHQLRVAKDPTHTPRDTGLELAGVAPEEAPTSTAGRNRVDRAIFLADMMGNSDVANAKDEHTAFKIASKLVHNELNAELTRRAIAAPSPHQLIQGDMTVVMYTLPAKQFDVIIADPPYGLNLHEAEKVADLDHNYDDSPENAMRIAKVILIRGYDVAKDDAHLYLFCDIEKFQELRYLAEAAGWWTFKTPLIWVKSGASGHTPAGLNGFRRSYECILFCYKGLKPFPQIYSDVLEHSEVRGKVHAAQKPVELYQEILGHSCVGGQRVLDPCAGSGVVFRACTALGLVATGIEMVDECIDLCKASIRGDV